MTDTEFLFDSGTQSPEAMVSVSQIQTYMSCTKKWSYTYVEGLSPRVERSYLTIGKLCHRGMEAAMGLRWSDPGASMDELLECGVRAVEDMWNEYMAGVDFLDEELPDMYQERADAVSIFTQALREFNPMKYEVLSVVRNGQEEPALELHFAVPCGGGDLHGYIDSILRDVDSGQVWCTDYKFRKSLSPDGEEQFNLQNAVYSKACEYMGIGITGTMTWQHVNTPAAEPKVNRDGSLSRAKVKTTWGMYRSKVEELGLDVTDYAEMEDKLSGIEFCRATLEYRSRETVDSIWHSVVVPFANCVFESRLGGGRPAIPHMYPWNCKVCSFSELCQAELRGYDADYIKSTAYVQKAGRK